MNKILTGILAILIISGIVLAEKNITEEINTTQSCITLENKAVKNGVNFPNFCADENTLIKNYCTKDEKVEQEYFNCECKKDICIIEKINEIEKNQTENNQTEMEECLVNWDCTEWTPCTKGKQTRTCNPVYGKPTQGYCFDPDDSKPSENQTCPDESSVWIWITVIVIIAVIVVGYFLLRKKPENKKLTTA